MNHTALPVTVIGGYLGAGKTTLVNHLLRHADGLKIAVLVNEFGALPIDADLIEAQDDNMISIAGGCVCCSYGNDLMLAMIDLAQLSPPPDHVLLEASGVALPGAIASSIGLLPHYRLDGVVVLADAETVRTRANDTYMGDTIRRQLEDADLIVLNKTDLIDAAALSQTRDWLTGDFGDSKSVETRHAHLPIDVALGRIHTDQEASEPGRPLHHGDLFASESFALDHPIDAEQLMQELTAPELGIVRAKGFTLTSDGKRREVQIVGHRWSVVDARHAAQCRIVCIGTKAQFRPDLVGNVIRRLTPAR
ncbi:MAG: CobW family GTP-binding protein [Hyphomicrobiaceae bacterium]